MSNIYQLSFFDLNDKTSKFLTKNSSNYFELFRNYISFKDIIPHEFYNHYYQSSGRNRKYSLEAMFMFFIYKNLRSITYDKTLINILKDSPDLRRNLGFSSVPDPSQISRFKINFLDDIHLTLDRLVSLVNQELQKKFPDATKFLIADTTGFEGYVTENNPKFFQSKLSTANNYEKTLDNSNSFNAFKYAQSLMPKKAHANEKFRLNYLNGHYGYFLNSLILTNGLGIIQDIHFPDEVQKFYNQEMPKQIKDNYDSKTLIPSLEMFFTKTSYQCFDYLLADSGFDGYDNYKYISKHGMVPIIPINKRNGTGIKGSCDYRKDNPNTNFYFDSFGNLICRKVKQKMNPIGPVKASKNSRADRFQYGCPLITTHQENNETIYGCDCPEPCSDALYGRKVNIAVDLEYRFNSAYPRDSKQWKSLYKKRTVCERAIAQLKDYININESHIRNITSLKSTILMAGIAQLVGVMCMIKSGHLENIRRFKSVA